MRLVDAHCHLNSDRLQGDVAEVVRAAAEAGVETLVMAGVDAACWRSQQALAARFPGVARMVFGLHPQVVAELDRAGLDKGLAELERMARGEPALVAVGETGLDRFTPSGATLLHCKKRACALISSSRTRSGDRSCCTCSKPTTTPSGC